MVSCSFTHVYETKLNCVVNGDDSYNLQIYKGIVMIYKEVVPSVLIRQFQIDSSKSKKEN